MKTKIILTILFVSILNACKKEYTCNCFNPGGIFKTYKIKSTKEKATQKCEQYANEYQKNPFSETACSLN